MNKPIKPNRTRLEDNENEEIRYLKNLILNVEYDNTQFEFWWDNDKKIIGALGSNSLGKVFEYKSIFDTVIATDEAIKKSLKCAIEYAYAEEPTFSGLFQEPSETEKKAIYYTENAVFRTIILWDMLAQLNNIKHGLVKDITKINYVGFLKNNLKKADENQSRVYKEYFDEKDDMSTTPHWKGNHKYLKSFRNQMAHRNSPNVTTMSNYSSKLRLPMRFVLKRLIEEDRKSVV